IKDSEATLHLLYKHQRDLANHPGNPHLYSCDFCTRRNMLPCDAECHRSPMGCLAKLLYALLSATSITDASSTTSSTAPPRGCSRHAHANKFTAFKTQARHQVDSLALDVSAPSAPFFNQSFQRAPALQPAPRTRERVHGIQNPVAS
ncbi:hypothetical protein T492DRAFT_857678, partial [Pavlovales sp. CCMP2436]